MNWFIVDSIETWQQAMDFVASQEILAYDVETTGLDCHKDKIIGFGVSNAVSGFYYCVRRYDAPSGRLLNVAAGSAELEGLLALLSTKKLLMFNARFDAKFTKHDLGVNLVPALYADVLLLKHTCDEEFPLDLKGIAKKVLGVDAADEQQALKTELKRLGAGSKEYYKASLSTIAEYCIKDCVLTFKLFKYYDKLLGA